MPSSYTPLLRFELPVQGELSGTWGNVANTAITTPVSEAIAGTTSITVGATNYTLTNGDGASANEARKMFITAIGSPGATREVICPSTSKLYVFFNNTTGGFAMTLKTSAGSGVAVPAGQRRLLYCDGTNVVDAVNGFGSLTLGTALGATSGGTGQASYAVGDLLYASTTTALSKLTVGATNAVLTVAAGIPAWVTTLPVASGGTGAATLAANNVLLGNGTAAVQTVAPGTAGNVLTSAGGTWTSAALPVAGVNAQVYTSGSGNFTIPANVTKLKVTVVGGGGGSAGSVSGNTGGGGGGGGAAIKWLTGMTPGNTLSYSVGAGGTAGTSAPGNGGAGSASTVATGTTGTPQTITTLTGGGGGAGLTAGPGGAGGAATNGDLNIPGGSIGGYGIGGGSLYACTNGYGTLSSNAYGGGASSALSPSGPGAAGAAGVIIFEW